MEAESKCPMTIENCSRYGVSDKQVQAFCDLGCSVICEVEFRKKFIEKMKANVKKEATP